MLPLPISFQWKTLWKILSPQAALCKIILIPTPELRASCYFPGFQITTRDPLPWPIIMKIFQYENDSLKSVWSVTYNSHQHLNNHGSWSIFDPAIHLLRIPISINLGQFLLSKPVLLFQKERRQSYLSAKARINVICMVSRVFFAVD